MEEILEDTVDQSPLSLGVGLGAELLHRLPEEQWGFGVMLFEELPEKLQVAGVVQHFHEIPGGEETLGEDAALCRALDPDQELEPCAHISIGTGSFCQTPSDGERVESLGTSAHGS